MKCKTNLSSPVPDRDTLAGRYFETLPYELIRSRGGVWLALISQAIPEKPVATAVLVLRAPRHRENTDRRSRRLRRPCVRAPRKCTTRPPLIALTDQETRRTPASPPSVGGFFRTDQVGLVHWQRTVNPDAPRGFVVVRGNPPSTDCSNPEKVSFEGCFLCRDG